MKNQPYILLFLAVTWLFSACSNSVAGKLVDARDYCTTKATGGDHEFAVFSAMKANLPAAILTADNKLIYLSVPSQKLALYATDPVKVKGKNLKQQHLIKPEKLWVKTNEGWKKIPLSN